jgi:hypothetical protein
MHNKKQYLTAQHRPVAGVELLRSILAPGEASRA